MDILNRCNNLSVESQLEGKTLRWLGHVLGCLTIDYLRSFCLVKSKGFAHLVALGLVSTMLRCILVKIVELVDRIEMRNTDCLERQYLFRT